MLGRARRGADLREAVEPHPQSMEMAVVQLGGHPVYTRGEEVGFDVRESVEDVTQVMAGYHGVLAAAGFDHGVVERMAAVRAVPIVNMLSDQLPPAAGSR